MANGKSIGQLREEERYHGPRGVRSVEARRTIDRAFTSPTKYMSEAVADTSRLMREHSPMAKKGKQEFDKQLTARNKKLKSKSAKGFR